MALFNFKKKDNTTAPACACSGGCTSIEAAELTSTCRPEAAAGKLCCIKVLGAGCKTCHAQYEYAKAAVASLGLDVEVEYITDMAKVMTYGVMSLPALVVNDKVVSMGKLLKDTEVVTLLQKLGF